MLYKSLHHWLPTNAATPGNEPGQRGWIEAVVGRAHLPEEDSTGAHSSSSRHVHRERGGGGAAHVGLRRDAGCHCRETDQVRSWTVQDFRRNSWYARLHAP